MIVQLTDEELQEVIEKGLMPFLTELLKDANIEHRMWNDNEAMYEIEITRK